MSIHVRMRTVNLRSNPIKRKNGTTFLPDKIINPVVLDELKFRNDYPFDFDILSPQEWKKFLKKYRLNSGQLLPRYTPKGLPIVYDVYIQGRMKHPLGKKTKRSNGYFEKGTSFFPGYDADGKRLHPLKYGRLDR